MNDNLVTLSSFPSWIIRPIKAITPLIIMKISKGLSMLSYYSWLLYRSWSYIILELVVNLENEDLFEVIYFRYINLKLRQMTEDTYNIKILLQASMFAAMFILKFIFKCDSEFWITFFSGTTCRLGTVTLTPWSGCTSTAWNYSYAEMWQLFFSSLALCTQIHWEGNFRHKIRFRQSDNCSHNNISHNLNPINE